jgi:hypothetical protein
MSNLGDFKKSLAGGPALQRGELGTVDEALAVGWQYLKTAADGAANTATADVPIWTNPFAVPVYVAAAKITPIGAGVVTDEADYATLTLKTNDGAGSATAIALTLATNAAGGGALTSNQSKAFPTLTKANALIPVGGQLWLNIAKAGAGKVIPISQIAVKFFKAES